MNDSDFPSRFAASPADALEFKLCALRTLRLLARKAVDQPLVNQMMCFDASVLVANAPLFFWAESTAQIVASASESFPIEDKCYYPEPLHAVCVFQTPTLYLEITEDELRQSSDLGGYGRRPLSALGWTVAKFAALPDHPIAMSFYGFVWSGSLASVVVQGIWPPASIPNIAGAIPADAESLQYARFALAAASFIEQRVVVESKGHIERHARKRAERMGIASTVKTIQLRAADRRDLGSVDGDGHRDYSCRWMVRGHWRKQYYPKAGTHAPVWIDTHIKGPEDKPLRAPGPEVFAVVR